MDSVGKRIRKYRGERKAVDIARLANISQPYFSQIENDRKRPSIDVYQAIADALGVVLTCLIPDDPEGSAIIELPRNKDGPLISGRPEKQEFIFERAPYAEILDRAERETRLLTNEQRIEVLDYLHRAIKVLQDVTREQSS